MRPTVDDTHGYRFHLGGGARDFYAYHASFLLVGLGKVENKIPYAIIDTVAMVLLDVLKCVGVVADQDIGTGINHPVGIDNLLKDGVHCVLPTPVQADDDIALGICGAQLSDAVDEDIHTLLAHAGSLRQIGVVFQGKPQ